MSVKVNEFFERFAKSITSMEQGKVFKREINRMLTILIGYEKDLSISRKVYYKDYIRELKERLRDIEPYDEEFKAKIADLTVFKDLVLSIESNNGGDLEDE